MKVNISSEDLRRLYFQGASRKDLAEMLGVRYNSMGHVLKNAGCYGRRGLRQEGLRNRCTCKREFFENTPVEFFYFLGYMFGDGCITKKHGRDFASVYSTDLQTILMFKSWTNPSLKMEHRVYEEGFKDGFSIGFADPVATRVLRHYGLSERKSYHSLEPNVGLENFWPFWVGLIDSDGCISEINGGQGRRICFYGTEVVSRYVCDSLFRKGVMSKINKRHDGLWVVEVCRIKDVKRCWAAVKGFDFKLRRKWEKIELWPRC